MATIINAGQTALTVTPDTTGALALQANGTTAVTINNSQNVGIGTSSPTAKLHVYGGSNNQFKVESNGAEANFTLAGTSYGQINNSVGDWYLTNDTSAAMIFRTASTERVRIDSAGNLGIGTSTPGNFGALAIRRGVSGTYHGIVASSSFEASDNINNTLFIMHNNDNGSTCFIGADASRLQIFNSSTGAGGVYLTGGGTSWQSASDERVKENLVPIENGLAKVASLRAVTGNYIKDETKKSKAFLIAQDVEAVLPEAVDSSNPNELGLAYTDVIPLLVASIKELKAELDASKQRITELENKS